MAPAKHHDPWWVTIAKDVGELANPGNVVTNNLGSPGKIVGDVTGTVHDVTGAAVSTEHFLAALTNPNTWIRVAEVAVGLMCIAVGLSAMTKTNPVAKATKAATKAAVL